MVSIGKLNKAQAEKYFKSQQEEYYKNQNSESFYGGKANKYSGDAVLEPSGQYIKLKSKRDFSDFLPDRPPVRKNEESVSAYDLTFSATKSLSVLTELTDDKVLQSKLQDIHDNAVCKTMQYVEKNIITTRLSYKDASGKRKYDAVHPEKIEWAAFRHHSSRENDPQLHTHVVIANRVYIRGKEYSIDARDLYFEHINIGKAYRAEVINQLQEMGIKVNITDYKKFLFEIDGIEQSTLDVFSKQSQNIDEVFKRLKKEYPFENDAKLKDMAEQQTRKNKNYDKSLEELRAGWKTESQQKNFNILKHEFTFAKDEDVSKAFTDALKQLTENQGDYTDLQLKVAVKQNLIFENMKYSEAALEQEFKTFKKKGKLSRLVPIYILRERFDRLRKA